MSVLPVHMYMYYTRASCPQRSKERIGFPGPGIVDCCKPLGEL